MSEALPLALVVLAFFLSVCAFVFGAVALIKVIAAEKSTHRVVQIGPTYDPLAEPKPVEEVIDVPLAVRERFDQPVDPPKSMEEYLRRQQAMAGEDDYEPAW